MRTQAALIALTCLAVSPAWAVNKCTGADGAVVFQDAPCAGKGEALTVRPASGIAKEKASAPGEAGPKKSDAQRIEEQVAASQKERRLRDLEQREVPRADAAIWAHLQACKDEQAQLEAAKGRYVQNLYGKTDAAQRASEQAAAAARCDTKDRELRARHEALRIECARLGGCG
jgi:hypothetical protein